MNNENNVIKENITFVQDQICHHAKSTGRDSSEITLIAVSKTKPISMLKEAYTAGCRDFGENKVQELVEKIENMPTDIRWHMIGHLQRNKVKYIVGKVHMIHSVDSLRLAEEISKESVKKNVISKILLEVNVAGEESKYGSSDFAENLSMLQAIALLPGIELCGLMTIAPFTEDAEENRSYFQKLRNFANNEAKQYLPQKPILSMGMTGDYGVAVEEGATHVRVGTGIFGERQYQI